MPISSPQPNDQNRPPQLFDVNSEGAGEKMAMDIEVIRSARRRKTVSAEVCDGTLRVSLPAWMSRAEEDYWVDEMYRRFERKAKSDRVSLAHRARTLARRYGLREPATIRWADNQVERWGSCTPYDQSIRISNRLLNEPQWVLDYVIIHELAHLSVAAHNAKFWALVNRYPKTERARGYLTAVDLGRSVNSSRQNHHRGRKP